MKQPLIMIFVIVVFSVQANGQYVSRVQKQVLFDVLKLRTCETLILKQDSLISSLRTSVSGLEGTVSSCLILNTDYQNQIASLTKVNFDNNKEIIILNQDKKRLKRQVFWLKVLIPVAIAGTILLSNN